MGLILIPILGPLIALLGPFIILGEATSSFLSPIVEVAGDWLNFFAI